MDPVQILLGLLALATAVTTLVTAMVVLIAAITIKGKMP